MTTLASAPDSSQAPWKRVETAWPTWTDSPTGLSPELQATLRRGWTEALAYRLERRRVRSRLGIEMSMPPQQPLLAYVARRRFFANNLRWYPRIDLWHMLQKEALLGLELLDACLGHVDSKTWMPVLLLQEQRIGQLYGELKQRLGDIALPSLEKLLTHLDTSE